MTTAIWTDPIVAETRRWREELMEEAGNSLAGLTQRLMDSQKRHKEKLVSLASEKAEKDSRQGDNHPRLPKEQ